MDGDLLPVGKVARRLGLGPERVRQLCDAGRLDHIRVAGGARLIPTEALERFVARRTKRERERDGRLRRKPVGR